MLQSRRFSKTFHFKEATRSLSLLLFAGMEANMSSSKNIVLQDAGTGTGTGIRLHSSESFFFLLKNGIPSRNRFYKDLDVQRALEYNQRIREEFVYKSHLQPPETFRVIDCRATMEAAAAGRDPSVVLINWHDAKPPFTAV